MEIEHSGGGEAGAVSPHIDLEDDMCVWANQVGRQGRYIVYATGKMDVDKFNEALENLEDGERSGI